MTAISIKIIISRGHSNDIIHDTNHSGTSNDHNDDTDHDAIDIVIVMITIIITVPVSRICH